MRLKFSHIIIGFFVLGIMSIVLIDVHSARKARDRIMIGVIENSVKSIIIRANSLAESQNGMARDCELLSGELIPYIKKIRDNSILREGGWLSVVFNERSVIHCIAQSDRGDSVIMSPFFFGDNNAKNNGFSHNKKNIGVIVLYIPTQVGEDAILCYSTSNRNIFCKFLLLSVEEQELTK